MKTIEKPSLQLRQIEGRPPQFRSGELAKLALTYARVFAGEPWHEVSKCVDGFSPQPVGSQCADCGEIRAEAYPLELQMTTIASELARPEAACFVLEDMECDDLVGFSWGFCYENADEFIKQKYVGTGAGHEQLRGDVRRVLGRCGIGTSRFYYLSETGIIDDERYRGRGISKEFVRLRSQFAAEQGLDVVQRTNIESPMFRTMRSAGFTQIMGANICEPDSINAKRVLFAKKSAAEGAMLDIC